MPSSLATIVWDIDGTLIPYGTSSQESHAQAMREAKRMADLFPTYVNTARPDSFCQSVRSGNIPSDLDFVPAHHFKCREVDVTSGDMASKVAEEKVRQLDAIREETGSSRRCTILVDDDEDNVRAAIRAGYDLSFLVQDAAAGITAFESGLLNASIQRFCSSEG